MTKWTDVVFCIDKHVYLLCELARPNHWSLSCTFENEAVCGWRPVDGQPLTWSRVYISSDGNYHQTSYITHTSLGNKIVNHWDVVGVSPVGPAPTTSWFSLNIWLQWIGQLQENTWNILVLEFGTTFIRGLMVRFDGKWYFSKSTSTTGDMLWGIDIIYSCGRDNKMLDDTFGLSYLASTCPNNDYVFPMFSDVWLWIRNCTPYYYALVRHSTIDPSHKLHSVHVCKFLLHGALWDIGQVHCELFGTSPLSTGVVLQCFAVGILHSPSGLAYYMHKHIKMINLC